MADCLFGRPGNNPYCIHRALDFEARGLRETIRRSAPAPGVPFDRAQFDLIEEPLPTATPDEIGGINLVDVLETSSSAGSLWSDTHLRSVTGKP